MLHRCFEPATREKANGNHRLLILDGHKSHETVLFLDHCSLYKILVLRLSLHTSRTAMDSNWIMYMMTVRSRSGDVFQHSYITNFGGGPIHVADTVASFVADYLN